jgi:hypothetical protein
MLGAALAAAVSLVTASPSPSCSTPTTRVWKRTSSSSIMARRATSSTSGSLSCATLPLRPKMVTRTPSRCSAWPSSRPMMPVPATAIDSGRSSQSNTASLVMTRGPASRHSSGMIGVEPVAITKRSASTSVCSSTCSSVGLTKRAWPSSRSSAGKPSTLSTTKPTKRSRSLRTRAMTALPSTRTGPGWTPKPGAACSAWAASPAEMSSLLGMQPTRAQVVP